MAIAHNNGHMCAEKQRHREKEKKTLDGSIAPPKALHVGTKQNC